MAERRFPSIGYWSRVTVAVVLTLGVLAAAWSVRQILILVLVAAVLAVGMEPAVLRLERLHVKRGWAVVVIFVAAYLLQRQRQKVRGTGGETRPSGGYR